MTLPVIKHSTLEKCSYPDVEIEADGDRVVEIFFFRATEGFPFPDALLPLSVGDSVRREHSDGLEDDHNWVITENSKPGEVPDDPDGGHIAMAYEGDVPRGYRPEDVACWRETKLSAEERAKLRGVQ